MTKFEIMKNTVLLIILPLFFIKCLSQCPHPGLNIQSASCQDPTSLKADVFMCSELKVKWQGTQNQTYDVKAEGVDPITGKISEFEASQNSCDKAGSCVATIPVKSGSVVNWSVQSVCTQAGNSLTGYEVKGQTVTIPTCPSMVSNLSVIHVYPIPTTGVLNIVYSGKITPNTVFSVYDMAGKKILSISGNAIVHSEAGYQLNLHGHLSGTYLLKISNGSDQSQTKFILVSN